MKQQPEITISSADLAELEEQLEKAKLPAEFVRALENELARANIVNSKDMPDHVVSIGSQVTFKILDSGRVFTKTLCFPADMHLYEDSISIFAPIGSALIGLSTGQNISWVTQRGEQQVEIIQVNSKKPLLS
ncbi:nucleoside diphosphate kinase regulator [Neptunicella sp.]|uniref:nucleoside diphosphate kinase regulator n=1 Tax=Neptunicella sp. TaxID=2125986 RepID=UPI003F68F495